MTTTAGMATGGIALGVVFGSFADNSSKRQQAAVANTILSDQNKIHIYDDKIYVGLNRLPGNGSI